MILYDERRQPVDLGASIGRGGEAVVYRLNGQPQRLAKVYEPAPRPNYARKLTWMLEHPPANPTSTLGHASLAWPDGLLFDSKRQLKGYCMPFIRRSAALLDVFNPRRRAALLPQFDRRYLHRVARNLSAALSALHASGYVAGDLNESNVLVTATALVTLIDADSFQVIEDRNSQQIIHPCPVGKLEYTPPELQGKRLAEVVRYPEHDAFGLGVLIFQLLMEGSHPFRAQWLGPGDPPPLEVRISQGAFPYTAAPSLVVIPPKNSLALDTLHPRLVELVRRCFVDGHSDGRLRPTPEQWERAVAEAEKALTTCETGHIYSSHLVGCPVCGKTAAGTAVHPASPAAPQKEPLPTGTGSLAVKIPPPAGPGQAANGAPIFNSAGRGQTVPTGVQNQPPAAASGVIPNYGQPASPGLSTSTRVSQGMARPGGLAGSPASLRPVKAAQWLQSRSAQTISSPASAGMTGTVGGVGLAGRSPRQLRLGQWLWRITYLSMIGGGLGALVGALPGLLMGAAAAFGGIELNWMLLLPLGGALGGGWRGWAPGQRVGRWVDRTVGWRQVVEGLGMVFGAIVGLAVGIVLVWAIVPVFVFPFLGARIGRRAGNWLWQVGLPVGWPQIWAGVAAVCMAAAGWVIAGAAGAGGLAGFGPLIFSGLAEAGVRPLLTTILSAAFNSGLGGFTAGLFSDLVARFLGLVD